MSGARLIAFLRALQAMLEDPARWHPVACANVRGRLMGEFEQCTPTLLAATVESTPVAWNLPCAVRYLVDQWEVDGHFVDAAVEKTALRYAALAALEQAGRVDDVWQIADHRDAMAAIYQARIEQAGAGELRAAS